MKILVLTAEPVSATQLKDALPGDPDPSSLELMVIAPALHDNALRFWLSDADDAIARADEVRRATVEQLSRDGVPATADTGEGDLESAARDALASFDAERVLLFVHDSDNQRHGEDTDAAQLSSALGRPVQRVVLGTDA